MTEQDEQYEEYEEYGRDSSNDTVNDIDTNTAQHTVESDDLSGRHPVQVTHLVFGIAFLAFVGIWAALTTDVVQSADLRWLLPVPWLLAGSAGLVASVLGRRARLERRRESQSYGG